MIEFWIVLAGVYVLGLPIVLIVLWGRSRKSAAQHEALAERIEALEKRLARRAGAPKQDPAPEQTAETEQDRKPAAGAVATPNETPWERAQKPRPARSVKPTQTAPAARLAKSQPRPSLGRRRPSAFDRALVAFGAWLAQNWVYAVAAVSLALAGLFLVQYGIEAGLLPPAARVLVALAFGATLVGGGEYLRRRWGDDEDSPAAFLPAVFSGAGIVTLFGAVLAARHMYDLIGPGTCFAALLAVAAGAILLGWLTGPLLSALGIVGAFATPFLLGGGGDPSPVVGYLAIVTLVGLTIDTYRRWRWLSALSLGLGYGLIGPLVAAGADAEWVIGFALIMPFATIVVMGWRLWPALPGAALLPHLIRHRSLRRVPRRMTLLHLVLAGSTLWLLAASQAGAAEFWASAFALTALAAGLALWGRGCAAMEDLPLLPALGLIGLVWLDKVQWGESHWGFASTLVAEGGGAVRFPPFLLLALAAGLGVVAAWRSLNGACHPRAWAFAAALVAPMMLVSLEVAWQPASVVGAYPWASAAMALAALMVLKLERFARAGDADRMRVSLVLISALGLISFALMLILSPAALTVALAVTVLVAVELDRRYGLLLLAWFAVLGAILVSARLVLDPGIDWARAAPVGQVSFAYLGSVAGLALAWWQGRARQRSAAQITLESAVLSLSAIYVALMLDRWIAHVTGSHGVTHWQVGLNALIWLIACAVQLWRLQIGGRLRGFRIGLASIYALLAGGYLARGLLIDNPFVTGTEVVRGWPVLGTLAVAYALPALFGLGVARMMRHLNRRLRLAVGAGGAALLLFWIVTEIAHFWRGPVLFGQMMGQPELYSYTVAMLVLGAGALYQAIARRSDLLRRLAMAEIAVTVAKVFWFDISGLDGLMRVFSFLALGLVLAGLAWLNRWAAQQGRGKASG